MQTKVCITIDTEFSIAGAFGDSGLRPVAEPYVWCEVEKRSEGLGFLLDCFKKYRILATFFIEALHRHYFQNDPMRPIVHRICDDAHEAQLHVHPCWSVFRYTDWWQRVQLRPRQDDFYGRSADESEALIREGIETFRDWGLPPPQAFRSGSLQHDDALYLALSRACIPYSSNIGLAIFNGGDPQYQLYSGCHDRHGVLECPVLTFNDWCVPGRRHLKSLTIAGTSFAEMRNLLEQANKSNIPLVVILTHPFEFIQSRDVGLRHARTHSVNQSRLVSLCRFLSQNRDRFSTSGFAAAAHASASSASMHNPLLKVRLWQSLPRMATQASYDRFGNLALSLKSEPTQ